jgi:hypothetical protein
MSDENGKKKSGGEARKVEIGDGKFSAPTEHLPFKPKPAPSPSPSPPPKKKDGSFNG